MRTNCKVIFLLAFIFTNGLLSAQESPLETWLTDPAKKIFFKKQSSAVPKTKQAGNLPEIKIDENQLYQEIDGFGFALTGGSASHIIGMSPKARAALLKELFDTTGTNIGTSYLRLSIGASDLNATVFSYNDLPEGQTDTAMNHFDLGADRKDVIPVLREILAINPAIKIMGSPWSPPTWMKTNNDTRGGSLKPEYYRAYAKYLARYITDMQKEGIRIDAMTIQNEPLHPGNNPSLLMLAPDQAIFIKDHLGPLFKEMGITTRIIIYDHNADRPDYPISILNDPAAKQYIDGSAFHLYGGKIEALSEVHNAHPDKHLYFTEQWVGGPGDFKKDIFEHVNNLVIGATRNWCRTVIEWNLAADPQYLPHTDRGGCDRCLGAVTIDKDAVTKNPAYYIIAHASKFVRPGSVRIASDSVVTLANVAFKTPGGKLVLIVLNTGSKPTTFKAGTRAKKFSASLDAGAVASYIF